jgi:6-phosphofructokinase
VGGSYQPTPVSDAPGLFERTAGTHFEPLPTLPLSVALQLVAPYNPTPTQDPQHDSERSVDHDRDATDEGPSPFEGTAPDSTPLERRDIYAALINHLPFPARLPLEGSSIEDHYVPDKEDALEHTKITDELLAEILEDRLGYSGYILESDVRCRKDVNIQLDGLVISDYVHALVATLDCGMEPRNIREIPYRALSQVEWFRVANALLAAIARGIIRSKEFTRAKNLSTELIPDNLPRGPGVDMPLTTGALLQALAEQIAGEIDIRNDRSTGEQIVAYFDWAKESAMKGAAKLAKHEAKAAHVPSSAQISFWRKEVETEVKETHRDDFLRSPEGLEAMEQFVRSIQSHDVTREARRNVVRMIENSLLTNKGEMIGIEREAKANLIARFSAESNAQEDEWRAAYFARLMERLKGGHTDARLVPGETASQFVRDVAGAINAEVEARVDRMVKTVEHTAREAYQSEMDRIVAKATAKGSADAISKAEEAYNVTMQRDAKVNLARTDIALQNIRAEYEQRLETLKKQTAAELDIELHSQITSFRERVRGDLGPLDNVLLEEITTWVETRGYQLTEIDREQPPTKRPTQIPGEGKKRRAGEQRSRSSSIASFTAPPSPANPVTPPMRAPIVTALMMDNNRTPTPTRIKNVELMDIEQSSVQKLQSGMEDLHNRKEAANQTVAASLHAPANQMAVSPTSVPAKLAAESVISTRPLPAQTTPPVDPMLAAILSALDRIQASVDSLDKRVKAVEKPAPRTKPTPASAAAVSMPKQPPQSRPSNPVIDLRAKITTPRLPKLTTLVPASPPHRIDDIDAFESYREDYDADFPPSAPRPAPPKAAQAKAAEWIEVKSQPNHRRGIINLDYATAARSKQVRNTAAQVTQAQNRTPQGGPQRRPADRPAANETIITIVRNGGSESKTEEEAIRALSPAFIILAARSKIEQLTKHAIVLVGGWWVSKLDKKGHKRRNGNFNFTAAGNVSHEQVMQFQHVFLEHLKVGAIVTAGNWVWAQLRHVRTTDHQQNIAGPDTLIKEMRRNAVLANVPIPQMPHYACAPHNLGEYATVVFAYMDHTGKIAKEAAEKGIWMFGERCQFVRLGDSPVFTQCGKCHELGHVTNMCPLPRNAARCYRCGGAHESGSHDFLCKANTHKVGGKCDCAYPCLLCKQTGHTCRDRKCSKRGAFPAPPLASAKRPTSTTPPQKQPPKTSPPQQQGEEGESAPRHHQPTQAKVKAGLHQPISSPLSGRPPQWTTSPSKLSPQELSLIRSEQRKS